ncbi:hypothetical protein [Paraflavitalea pollutisoli]|uniref:hypothetical protein n=1 Tax=Paraflavitalea pollutisoli TaxID=3034143 RepID=UPI0023EC9D14|nr:hypothetical protein [Paraflavitalea sp. H1-2-19X]
MIKKYFPLLIILSIPFLSGKCPPDFRPEIKNIICLVDFSNSLEERQMLSYAEGIKTILYAMGPEDRLIVYPIDGGSITDRVAIVYEDFRSATNTMGVTFKHLNLPDSISPPFKKKGEDAFTAASRKQKRLDGYVKVIAPMIVRRLDSLKQVRRPYGRETDIFSAIYSVKDDMVKQKEKSMISGEDNVNYLVIFSDLVQESELANFNTKKGIQHSEFQPLFTSLREKKLLCNLQQAKVVVYDSYSTSIVSQSPMAKINVRNFWEEYFSDTTINVYQHQMKYFNTTTMDELYNVIKTY